MRFLLPEAEKVAALLISRKQTIAIAESSAGGLITAALLAVPGASAYCLGGAVIYTGMALRTLLQVEEDELKGLPHSSEALALVKAQLVRKRLSATWGLSEGGVAGPTGNKYGYAPGHACIAVSGPIEHAKTIATGSDDRVSNMYAFADAALRLMAETLAKNS